MNRDQLRTSRNFWRFLSFLLMALFLIQSINYYFFMVR